MEITDRIKSALGKVRKEARHKLASSEHRDASQYLEKGRKKYNKKDYKTADKFFTKAVQADSQYAMAHYFLGLSQYKLKDSDAAMRSWNAAINLDPGSKYAIKADEKIQLHKARTNRSVDHLEDRLKNK